MNRFFILLCAVGLMVSPFGISAQTWTDISTTLVATTGQSSSWPDMVGCAGVCVNRLNGDVVINITSFGLWRSTNKGSTWTRIDQNMAGGKAENGHALQVDQNDPKRIAIFSLDGGAAITADGTTWKQISRPGRGYDYGSVDWLSPSAKVMLATVHEDGGKVNKSLDGGTTWTTISGVTVNADAGSMVVGMVGVIDSNTFIHSNGSGINRSADRGQTWTKVSNSNPTVRVPVQFKGKYYLGAGTALLSSADKGLTWAQQGAALPTGSTLYRGPYFGADENTMVVIGCTGDIQTGARPVYKTTDAGATWATISTGTLPAGSGSMYKLGAFWWGNVTWDPFNNVLYTSCMSNPVFKKELGQTSTATTQIAPVSSEKLTMVNSVIRSGVPFTTLEIFSLAGKMVYDRSMAASYSMTVPLLQRQTVSPMIYRVTGLDGEHLQMVR